MTYAANQTEAVNAAISKFDATSTDPKAAIIAAIVRSVAVNQTVALLFYHGPTAPRNAFGTLLDIPFISKDVATRSFTDLVFAVSTPFYSDTPVRYILLLHCSLSGSFTVSFQHRVGRDVID